MQWHIPISFEKKDLGVSIEKKITSIGKNIFQFDGRGEP